MTKDEIFNQYKGQLTAQGFTIIDQDDKRPWGGFFVIDPHQVKQFINTFFSDYNFPIDVSNFDLKPKILLVEPNKRLSWQVHNRRSELWRIITGNPKIYLSETDQQPSQPQLHPAGDFIDIRQGIRHRIGSGDQWVIVAEIWIHSDPENPSTEEDVRRIADDFLRAD